MRYSHWFGLTGLALAALLSGCGGTNVTRNPPVEVWNDMKRQPKYLPQAYSPFFSDNHQTARYPVAGTIARGFLKEDEGFYTGQVNGQYVGKNPLTVDMALLKIGQQKFNTYCSPCHGRTGSGQGIVTTKSGWIASNLYEDRVIKFADGDIFDVITHGRRSMPGYRAQIQERDRWAIIAYVRALQRLQTATPADVPADAQSR